MPVCLCGVLRVARGWPGAAREDASHVCDQVITYPDRLAEIAYVITVVSVIYIMYVSFPPGTLRNAKSFRGSKDMFLTLSDHLPSMWRDRKSELSSNLRRKKNSILPSSEFGHPQAVLSLADWLPNISCHLSPLL